MQNSNNESKQQSPNNTESEGIEVIKKTPKISWWFLLWSGIGLIDTSYLTSKHYSGEDLTCSLTGGCGVVTNSAYATILGIPVALLGALYYLTVLVLTLAYLDRKQPAFLTYASHLTWAGLIASVYFVSLQAFVIQAWCQFCIGSALTSTLLFIGAQTYLRTQKKHA